MILVLMAICLILIGGGFLFAYLFSWDEDCYGFVCIEILLVLGLLSCIITAVVLGVKNSSEKALYRKIEICQEENTRLEQSIDDIVKNYLKYETEVYEQFKNDSSTVLIQLFPELKGNELVSKQMEIVQSNNSQIKELNSKIADLTTVKWWLYFGE